MKRSIEFLLTEALKDYVSHDVWITSKIEESIVGTLGDLRGIEKGDE